MKDVEKSYDNLYKGLSYENAEEMEAKAVLAREIYRIIKKKKLSQNKAAQLLGLKQPSLCNLLKGRVSGFSTDRLIRLLKLLGQDIDICIRPSKKSLGSLSVYRSIASSNALQKTSSEDNDLLLLEIGMP